MKAESLERFGTSRLHAERLRAEHLAALLALHANPRMMATLGGVRSEAQTRAYLAANLDHWEHYGFGLWMLRDRAGRLAGRAGLRRVAITGAQETEIAYALLPEFWGRGLATEIAQALRDIGLARLGLSSLIAFTLVDNRASRRVMEKIGLRFERAFEHGGLPHVLYRIARNATPAGMTG
ncbi:MAG: GNAT family N-acetyltransferase [Stellaceae bacterium]